MRGLGTLLRSCLAVFAVLAVVVACQDYRNALGPDLREPPEDSLRLSTYNVHYIVTMQAEGRWSPAGWDARKEPMARAVEALDADIIAFQEMETFSGGNNDDNNLTREFLLEQFPELSAGAVGDWRSFPSTQPIFYRISRFELLDQGWFFFSETPDVIYSRTFNGSYPAYATWAVFRARQGGATFRVVNLHTDYESRENRARSIDLVARHTEPWIADGETVFVVGDFNARLGSDLHRRLEDEGLTFVPVQGATYHLDRGLNLFGAIDHIAYTRAEPVGAPMVLREKLGEVWPTDHYPVVADFKLE